MTGLCEHLALGILNDQTPRVFPDLDGAIVGTVGDGVARLCRAPCLSFALGFESITEHHILLIGALGLYR